MLCFRAFIGNRVHSPASNSYSSYLLPRRLLFLLLCSFFILILASFSAF